MWKSTNERYACKVANLVTHIVDDENIRSCIRNVFELDEDDDLLEDIYCIYLNHSGWEMGYEKLTVVVSQEVINLVNNYIQNNEIWINNSDVSYTVRNGVLLGKASSKYSNKPKEVVEITDMTDVGRFFGPLYFFSKINSLFDTNFKIEDFQRRP